MPDNPNTAEPKKPRRRWSQFKLRTLLIGVVLVGAVCGYIGREAKIVRERKSMLAEIERRGGEWEMYSDQILTPETRQPLPSIRVWLGDDAVFTVYVHREDLHSPFGDRIKQIFPEAAVLAYLLEQSPEGI